MNSDRIKFQVASQSESWSILGCLLQPGLLLDQPLKSMRVNSSQLINSCGTRTDPAAGTKSIGLAADAHGVMVFANPSRLFHRAPGLTILTRTWSHLDSFIVLPDSSAICRDLQKPRHRDTDANSIKPPDCYM